jgi:hypothetical protein
MNKILEGLLPSQYHREDECEIFNATYSTINSPIIDHITDPELGPDFLAESNRGTAKLGLVAGAQLTVRFRKQ